MDKKTRAQDKDAVCEAPSKLIIITFGYPVDRLLQLTIQHQNQKKTFEFPIDIPFQEVLKILNQEWLESPFFEILIQDPDSIAFTLPDFYQSVKIPLPSASLIRQKIQVAEKFLRYLERVVPRYFSGVAFTVGFYQFAPIDSLLPPVKKGDEALGKAPQDRPQGISETEEDFYAGMLSDELLEEADRVEESGDFNTALRIFQYALGASESEERVEQVALCYSEIGRMYWKLGKEGLALQHLYQALVRYAAETSWEEVKTVLQWISPIYDALNDPDLVTNIWKRIEGSSKREVSPVDVKELEASIESLMVQGTAAEGRGDLNQALECFQRAVQIADEINYLHIDSCYWVVGHYYARRGQISAALDYYYYALAHCEREGGPLEHIALILVDIGSVFGRLLSRHGDAQDLLVKALDLCPQLADHQVIHSVLVSIAKLYRTWGDQKTASRLFMRAKLFTREIREVKER